MKHTLLMSAALCAIVATNALAQNLPMISEIEATTDLTSVQNAAAATYWQNVDADLEAAIAARLTDRLGDEGLRISIDVGELELANAFEASLGIDQSLLSGKVNVTDQKDNSNFKSFEVFATSEQVVPFLPVGTDITILPADSPEFYAALIQAFADGVVANIDN